VQIITLLIPGEKISKPVNPIKSQSSTDKTSTLFMAMGIIIFVTIWMLIEARIKIIHRAALVGLIMTIANYILAIIAKQFRLWDVRGRWPVFGYPLTMVIGWFFLIAGFCLTLGWLHYWWSKLIFVLLCGALGSFWDLKIHTSIGTLTLIKAKYGHVILYWFVLSFISAFLYMIVNKTW